MSLKKTAYGFFNIVGMNRQKRFLSSLRCGQKDSIAKNARKNGDKVAIFPLIPKATLSFRPKGRNLLIRCVTMTNTVIIQKKFLSLRVFHTKGRNPPFSEPMQIDFFTIN